MNFREYLELQESNLAVDLSVAIRDYARALTHATAGELLDLKRALGTVFSRDATPETLKHARKILLSSPKLGLMLAPLILPVPFGFSTLLLIGTLLRKYTGISILPERFYRVFSREKVTSESQICSMMRLSLR